LTNVKENHNLTLGSLFDGIGGFPYAGLFYGIKPLWASEIMPQAISVTKRHFPDMEHVGDITTLDGAALPPVDIITFGSPCQDLSTAGRRAGLDGKRSNLFYEAIRIIDEMRDKTHGQYPKYAVWENVPGALSSGKPRGSDFQAVIEAFTKTEVSMPVSEKWANAGLVRSDRASIAWRILNAQYHGVPQRRRRIFLVASFGGGCPAEILFIEKSLRGDFKACCQEGQGVAAYAQRGTGGSVCGESGCIAFAANQRDEVRDLGVASGALQAQPGMKQQTFLAQKVQKPCLTPWDVQSRRIHSEDGRWPALYGEQGGGHGYAAITQNPNIGLDGNLEICTNCLNPWDTQQSRVFTEDGLAPTLAGADGGGGRNPAGLVIQNSEVAAFLKEPSSKARGIGYSKEVSPTLKSSSPCLCERQTIPFEFATVYGLCGKNSNSMLSPNPHSGIYVAETTRTIDQNGGNPSCNQGGMLVLEPTLQTLRSVMVLNDQGGSSISVEKSDISPTLRCEAHGHLPIVAREDSDFALGVHQGQGGDVNVSQTAYSLTTNSGASSRNAPLVAHKDLKTPCNLGIGAAGLTSKGNGDCYLSPEYHATLSQGGGMPGQGYPAVVIPVSEVHPSVTGTLVASGAGLSRPGGMGSEPDLCVAYERPVYALQGNMIGRQDHNGPRGSGVNEDVCFTVTATDVAGIATTAAYQEAVGTLCHSDTCFSSSSFGGLKEGVGTLRAQGGDNGGGSESLVVSERSVRYIVRRLTPTECERLQGFPDGWTKFGHDGKEIADTRRYMMLGNSLAIPCVAFVLGGIVAVEIGGDN
jgi:DNA (cytosine-5)-methyltransferase 1